MSCEHVQELISPLLDRRLAAGEREKMLAHLQVCRKCDEHLEAIQNQRKALRRMDCAPVPAGLTAQLRVMASHERERHLSRATLAARFRYWSGRMELMVDNLMRPFALPFAGGLLSALVIFSVLVPSLSFHHNFGDEAFFTSPDGEVVLVDSRGGYVQAGYLDPRILPLNIAIPDNSNAVTLTVDENGKVCDWYVSRGQLTPELLNVVMFSQFKPATNFGLPTAAKVNAVQQVLPGRMRS
jgi:hypothetical protein